MHRRSDAGDEVVDRKRRDGVELEHVAHHDDADELRGGELGAQLGVIVVEAGRDAMHDLAAEELPQHSGDRALADRRAQRRDGGRPHGRRVPRGQHRAHEPFAELLDRPVERGPHEPVGTQRNLDDLGDEALLVCEVVVHERRVDARSSRDRAHRRSLVPALAELIGRGDEDAGPGVARFAPRGRPGRRGWWGRSVTG